MPTHSSPLLMNRPVEQPRLVVGLGKWLARGAKSEGPDLLDPSWNARLPQEDEFSWVPESRERVIPVIGCLLGCGASVSALAVSGAAQGFTRIIECTSGQNSGLQRAARRELGWDDAGWRQSQRSALLIERRTEAVMSLDELPVPSTPRPSRDTSILDISWSLGHVLASQSWVRTQVLEAPCVLLVTEATVAGMTAVEQALTQLGDRPTVCVVREYRDWSGAQEAGRATGPLTRARDRCGDLVMLPQHSGLALGGIDSKMLPEPILSAGAKIWKAVVSHDRTGSGRPEPQ